MGIEHLLSNKKASFYPSISPNHTPPYCLPVPVDADDDSQAQGETRPFRNARVMPGLRFTPEEGVYTVMDIVRRATARFGDNAAIASRTKLRTHIRQGPADSNGNKKQLSIPELSEYTITSYRDYETLIAKIGSGLLGLKLRPRHDKLCIWSQTSARWLAVFHGGASQSIALVTAYSSLGPTGLQHALVSTDAAAIFVDADSISRLAATLESAPCVGLVIYDADESTCVDIIHGLESRFDQVKFVHFDEVCAIGERNPAAPSHPSADDLCAIFYTSGSTGEPKGVPMRHKNVVAAGWLTPCSYSHGAADISLLVAGFDVAIGRHFDSDDRYLAYLPLAHVLEFAFEHACLFWGVCLGYGSPRTLFDSSVENCKGDLCELRPTYILGVPAIWETARKAIINLIGASNRDRQTIFWEAYESKKKTIGTNATFPVDRDERVFWEARNLLGGRLRFMLSGGGPIAENTQEFMSLVVAPLVNGFGLTETMAIGAIMDPCEWHTGSLGSIPGCADIKLVDYEEAGYLTSSKPPEGEIWIRGGCVAEGYWRNDAETEKAFTGDGWFKTGDIGRINDTGTVMIIDRKKNLIKTLSGEYIAIEKLESIYRSAPVVSNICVHADSTRAKPFAIILPVEKELNRLLSGNKGNGSLLSFTDTAVAQQLVLEQLQQQARNYDLASMEIVEVVVLSDLNEWNPMNGMTTAVGKLNRKNILKKHEQSIRQLYIDDGKY